MWCKLFHWINHNFSAWSYSGIKKLRVVWKVNYILSRCRFRENDFSNSDQEEDGWRSAFKKRLPCHIQRGELLSIFRHLQEFSWSHITKHHLSDWESQLAVNYHNWHPGSWQWWGIWDWWWHQNHSDRQAGKRSSTIQYYSLWLLPSSLEVPLLGRLTFQVLY